MYHVIANLQSIDELQRSIKEDSLISIAAFHEDEKATCIEALESMKESIGYLDENYGENRHLEHDLGGYGIALLKQEDYNTYYHKILEHHHMTEIEPEFEDAVAISPSLVYIRQTFIISSDYTVVILFCKEGYD